MNRDFWLAIISQLYHCTYKNLQYHNKIVKEFADEKKCLKEQKEQENHSKKWKYSEILFIYSIRYILEFNL